MRGHERRNTWGLPRIIGSLVLLGSGLAIRPATAAVGDAPIMASAFIDLNADGQLQAGEQAFTDLTVTAYDGVGGSSLGVLDTTTKVFTIDVATLSGSAFRVEYS